MASYTDNSQISFNPYLSQMPIIGERSDIAKEKQQNYNQGIQRIQGQIDNVAGLDVIRNVDKQYLQSKLNELGSKLKTVAAGDFSNFQLVNSVGGMANQIIKDPTIQNSVASTQKVRRSLSDKDEANKAGKGSIENDWDLMTQINDYSNNTDLKTSFNGGYTPYVDISKKIGEVIKTLHEQGSTEDIPYTTDAKGNPIVTDAMIEKIHKGITSPQIANAIRASFDENDLRQFNISGKYHYRNTTPEDLKQIVIQKNAQDVSQVQNRIDSLKVFAVTKKDDSVVYNQTLGVIKQLENSISPTGQYATQLNSNIHQIMTNPDQVKTELYKNAYIEQYSIGHAWDESAVKWVANPIRAQMNSNRQFTLEQNKFALDQSRENFDEGYKTSELKLRQEDIDIKRAKQTGLNKTNFTIQTQGLADKNLVYTDEIAKKISVVDNQLSGIKGEILDAFKKELIRQNIDPNSSTYKTLFNTQIDLKDEHAIDSFLDNIYSTNPAFKAKFSPELSPIIEKYHDAFRQKEQYQNNLIFAEKMADSKMQSSDDYKDLQRHLINKPTFILPGDATHTPVSFTAQDQLNFAVKTNNYMQNMRNLNTEGMSQSDLEQIQNKALSTFTPDELRLFQSSYMPKIRNDYNTFYNKVKDTQTQKNKEINSQLASLSPELVPEQGTFDGIDRPNALKNREYFEEQIKSKMAGNKEDSLKNLEYNYDTLKEWFDNSKIRSGLSYGFRRDGNGYFLTVTDGSGFQKVKIDDSEARQLGITISPISIVQQNIVSNGGSTNTRNGTPQGAAWQNVGGVKNSHVVGDLQQVVGDPTKVIIRLQAATTNGWKELSIKTPYSIGTGMEFLSDGRMDDAYIEDLFKKSGVISKTDQILKK